MRNFKLLWLFTRTAKQFHSKTLGNNAVCTSWTHVRYFSYRREGILKTMKVKTPEFDQLFTPELIKLKSIFDKYGFEMRIAGGAVRDLLMNRMPHDVDFATTATPEEMKGMFEKEQIRMINNKGEKHGTITARINDKENFEVTTLRIDVRTDGRHAEVEFTKDWQLDANRRDLTINAMFLGFDGTLYDYFSGKEDLDQRKVCFVGSAADRICEDYLRILRYFRFYGRIAKGPDSHEQDVLSAIQDHKEGLSGISGERIWLELKKITCGRFNGPVMHTMLSLHLGKFLGFPEKVDEEEFQRVCNRASNLSPQPITFLTALLHTEEDVNTLNKRLKMSNDEVKIALFIIKHRKDQIKKPALLYCMDLHNDTQGKDTKTKERIAELLRYWGNEKLLGEFLTWSPQKFPITGYDLFTHNVPKGPVFSKTLSDLRQVWKESSYTLSKEELLDRIAEIVKRHT